MSDRGSISCSGLLLLQALCHHWPNVFFSQDSIVHQRFSGWVDAYVSSLAMGREPSHTKDRNRRMKVLFRHRLNLSMFNKLYGCCLQQWDLAVSLWRTTYCFGSRVGSLGISMRTLCPIIQLYVAPSGTGIFGDKRWPVGAHITWNKTISF